MNKYLLLILCALFTLACNTNKNNDKPAAKVNSKILYSSEVAEVVPNNSTKEDSTLIADNFIHQWIKKQLIISKAELNLSDKDKDVSRMVEDYRSSLIIHKYKQQLIEQKLDTIVTQAQIDNYYRKFTGNFILNRNIIKALFIKIPKPVPDFKRIQKLYKSEKEEDLDELEDYCFQNATKFDNFSGQWINAKEFLNRIPTNFKDEDKLLKRVKHIESEDSTHYYFAKIKAVEFKNNIAPLPFVRDDIKKILINRRKIEFIKNLEENIYRDAESKNKFKIY
ncbi:hypothetical protein ACT3CE_00995 [Marinifilum sp. RC60d5]|uniref:hypothetical protein n=1 Tax=Marinifilum sp. RC60d5 TaxID=3458414 RepID=UPI004037354F